MLSAELDPMPVPARPRPSASWPLPKLPRLPRLRVPLPIRAAACRNCYPNVHPHISRLAYLLRKIPLHRAFCLPDP